MVGGRKRSSCVSLGAVDQMMGRHWLDSLLHFVPGSMFHGRTDAVIVVTSTSARRPKPGKPSVKRCKRKKRPEPKRPVKPSKSMSRFERSECVQLT